MIFCRLLRIRLPQLQTGFQCWRGVGSCIICCFGLVELILFPLGNRTHRFFLRDAALDVTQECSCSPSWPLGCRVWLVVGTWPKLIWPELMLGLFKKQQEEGFSLLWTWNYAHVSLEEWSPPWEFPLLEMRQHTIAEPGDGERLLLDNFIWVGEFSLLLEIWLSWESSVLNFNACSRANDCL